PMHRFPTYSELGTLLTKPEDPPTAWASLLSKVELPSRIFVFTSKIYQAIAQAPSDYGTATALAAILALISLTGILVYQRLTRQAQRFATVTGKAFRPRLIDLGRWRYVMLAALCVYGWLMIGLPMLVLVWMSLISFAAAPSVRMLSRLTLDN